MCGIVGYVGTHKAVPIILEGLKRLEYRGYDSAGLAVHGSDGQLAVRRAQGKLRNLEEVIRVNPVDGSFGIGHTRWATHGRPTEENAHPHRDCHGDVVVVHNGIVENYLGLKALLQSEGHIFKTETDTEVIAHLVEKYFKGNLEEAVRAAVQEITGVFALAVISRSDPNKIVAARSGPLGRVGQESGRVFLDEMNIEPAEFARFRQVKIIACGTSWHAALAGKFMIEKLARMPVEVDYGSEFRYRDPILDEHTLTVVISQSGETADTLAAQREAKSKGSRTLAICNVVGSMITREAAGSIYTHAGPEIGVASTKAFTSQLTALFILAMYLGQANERLDQSTSRCLVQELVRLPGKLETVL